MSQELEDEDGIALPPPPLPMRSGERVVIAIIAALGLLLTYLVIRGVYLAVRELWSLL
jgi:hypothetical protein